jgi:integrase
MAQIKRLTALQIGKLTEGVYPDGGNLYLRIRANSRKWLFRYKRGGRDGKTKEIGLGSVRDRSLAQAREIAGRMRTALADGTNPITMLKAKFDPQAKTFKSYAIELIESKRIGFKSNKHVSQWRNTLEEYAFPMLGNMQPGDIAFADVKAVLTPLWETKTETASRLRQRIEAVLDYAAVLEGNDRRNPARWKGNLDKLFQPRNKVSKPKHHPAAKYADVPAIMAALREKDCTSAYCLRWTILTAARSGESRGATWSEIDLAGRVWAIPEARMKAFRAHNVPLCDEALEILAAMKLRKVKGCDYVFPGARDGLLSDVAVNKTLHAISPSISVHGFRSSQRQWGAETTSFSNDVLEFALAHVDTNKVREAYQRSNLPEKRRELAIAWGNFCAANDNVIRLAKVI